MKNSTLYYSVGPLLYCPANNETVADSIINQRFGNKFSLALCLEDTIQDNCIQDAEQKLINSINKIYSVCDQADDHRPDAADDLAGGRGRLSAGQRRQ